MFYDERIEAVKGRVAKKSILISVIIALVFGTLRTINALKNGYETSYLWFICLEYAILLLGGSCLILGRIRKARGNMDEREAFEEIKFYNKAFPILIKTIAVIYAVLCPVSLYYNNFISMNPDLLFGEIIAILGFTVGIYAIYSFKKEDVYFNYSILDNDRYYNGVLRNIGKYSIWVLFTAVISVSIFIGIALFKQKSVEIILLFILYIIILYTAVLFTGSIIYFVYSALEKASYESKRFVSIASITSLAITVVLQIIWSAFVIYVDRLPISESSTAVIISRTSLVSRYFAFALMIFFTYFAYEYKKKNKGSSISVCVYMLLICQIFSFLISRIIASVQYIFINELTEIEMSMRIRIWLVNASLYSNVIFRYLSAIGIALLILSLIGDREIHYLNAAVIILIALMIGVEIFLGTQINSIGISIYKHICESVILLYLTGIIICIGKKPGNIRPCD